MSALIPFSMAKSCTTFYRAYNHVLFYFRVIAVAVGDKEDLDSEELVGIASEPTNANLFYIGNFKSLKTLESKFFTTICYGMFHFFSTYCPM